MADRSKAVLELKGVDVIFTKPLGLLKAPLRLQALKDISLKVLSGEVLAVVGESGGGKTTLGNVVTGILKPTAGQILFEGKDIARMDSREHREFRRQVQIVQQDAYAALNPMHTVAYSLSKPLERLKLASSKKKAMERVAELLELVELRPIGQYIDKYPHQLSGGQRQRILLARAMGLGPKVIVADEPVSMIDVSLRVSALNLMRKLNRELSISFVYITHDLGTARYIGREGRILVLYLGTIVETGRLPEVIGNPRHPYLQALLSSVPIPDPDLSRHRRKVPLTDVELPSIVNPPPGCRFHTRCPFAEPACRKVEPALRSVATSEVACHLAERIPAWTIA
jgi:peptide/nickel transport system ATP-binding protein